MQQCPNCGHPNRAGVVFCENCGASLIGKLPLDTKSLSNTTSEEKAEIGIDSSVLTDVKVQGISSFSEGDMLRLEIEGSPEPIILEPKAEAIFGRRDPATGALPDIDLTPFAGYRMGVSRRHAAIRYGAEENLDLWDLGSSNGTYLNGQRLNAHRPYRLHNGDEIRLGQMMIRISFEPGEIKKVSDLKKKAAEEQSEAADSADSAAPPPEAKAETDKPEAAAPAAQPAAAAEPPTTEDLDVDAEKAVPEVKTVALSDEEIANALQDDKPQSDAADEVKESGAQAEAAAEPEKQAAEGDAKPAEKPKAEKKDDSPSSPDSSNKKRD